MGTETDPPDLPFDPDLPRMAGARIRDGGGMFSRELEAVAATRRHRARQLRSRGDMEAAAREEHDADYLTRHAERFRDPVQAIGGPLAVGNGGEVATAAPAAGGSWDEMLQQAPDMLRAEATEHRMALTAQISSAALTLGLEAAEGIEARDPLERNLAHQAAAAHAVGMQLLAKASAFATLAASWAPADRQQWQSMEAARMAGAAARVLDASQRAMLTLERLRNGGRQVVVVQRLEVGEGGQAMVAGAVETGGRRK